MSIWCCFYDPAPPEVHTDYHTLSLPAALPISTVARAVLTHADDRLTAGTRNRSNIVQLGATQRLMGKRLELDAQTEFALGGADASIDFPTRHRLGARFAINRDVNLVGSYEIADGDTIKARTARLGFADRKSTRLNSSH